MTAKVVKHLTKDSKRVVLTTATPIQKNLLDMHSLMEALQLQSVFGSEIGFKNHFCVVRKNKFTLRSGRVVRKEEIIGQKNIVEFQRKIYPYFIKRTFFQVGQELPDLMVRPVWLGLHPQQQEIYNQQKQKLIKAQDEGKIREVRNKGFHSIMQTLAGTRTFGLKEDVSMKLDTVEFFIKEKLGKNEKVIIYSFYKETVKVLQERLEKAGISGVVTITGDTDAREKEAVRCQFMEDKNTRILLGTGAIEVAMNLQKARYLIMVDLIMNPQRIVQLIGRMRRLGSEHRQVVLYVLLSKDTVEERLWKHLRIESAISDAVFGEKSDVFPPLNDTELMMLLRQGK
jgi:SNF2 family DNA or RNA helicase